MLLHAARFHHLSPDLVHGFSTRKGGVSAGRRSTLHLGVPTATGGAAVRENLRRFAVAAGYAPATLVTVTQVHGAAVVRGRDVDADTRADGLWARREDGPVILGVRSADCVPVLLAARDASAVAAIHSGWRGTLAGAVGAAAQKLFAEGVEPRDLFAALGPCIGVRNFEVGDDVAAQFPGRFVRRDLGPKPHVDLRAVITSQLAGLGVPVTQIDRVGGCTFGEPANFFSLRRDKAGTGSQLSVIGYR